MRTDFQNIDELVLETNRMLTFFGVKIDGMSVYKVDKGMYKAVVAVNGDVFTSLSDSGVNLVIQLYELIEEDIIPSDLSLSHFVNRTQIGVSKKYA